MIVSLITSTHDALRVMYTAAHCCYSPLPAGEVWFRSGSITAKTAHEAAVDDQATRTRMLRTVRGCIVRNHNTVLRHASFTFAIDGISRACATQLTRHGPGWAWHDSDLDGCSDDPSFDQQSLRYVKVDTEPEWVIPPGDDMAQAIIRASAHRAWLDYRALLEGGTPAEDARAVLPLCTPTNLVATANLAALSHFWRVRGLGETGKPQDEIRELAGRMLSLVVAAEPWLGEFFTVGTGVAA